MSARLYRNPLRRSLKRERPAFGLWVTLANATMTELAVEMGLDWVCIDMEHGATGYRDVLDHARAARGSELAVLVRVPAVAPDPIARCLDLGVDGVVLPLVRSAQEVEQALAYARYPTSGRRGLGGERAQRWGRGVGDYIATANDEIMVIPMIETKEAAAAAAAIFALPGLDFAFVGPGDLASSLGQIGQWDTPENSAAIAGVIAAARAAGVTLGTYGAGPADLAARAAQGFRFLAIGSDVAMLADRIGQELTAAAALLSKGG